MLRFLQAPLRFLRRYPLRTVLGLALCAAATMNLWAWYHFRSAEQALHADELDMARRHVALCLHIWGRSAATHLLAARIERVSGHFPEGEQHLKACAHLEGKPTEALQLEQLLFRAQLGDLNEVEPVLWKWVEVGHPESARILEALAQGYIGQSRLGMALDCLNKLLEREPSSSRALHWRGWVHERLEQPEQALPDYLRAVELAPTRWGTRLRLVRLLLERCGTQAAAPHLDELWRTHPDVAAVQVALARCRHLQGKGEEAIHLLDQTLAAHPRHLEALTLRGELASLHESPAAAEHWLKRARQERPADPHVLYLLQKCLDRQGKDREAAQVRERYEACATDTRRLAILWNEQMERTPHDPNILGEIGAILLRLGEEKQGLAFLYRALGEDGNHRATHEELLRYYEARGDRRRAAEHRDRLRRLQGPVPLAPERKE